MRGILFLGLLFSCAGLLMAQPALPSLDKRFAQWDIDLTTLQFRGDTGQHYLSILTTVDLHAKQDVDTLYFDLLAAGGRVIDSVYLNQQPTQKFSFRNDTLAIAVNAKTADAVSVSVWSTGHYYFNGFGGVYGTNPLYNIGVSLTEIPHSYGRALFPCFDNFVSRCRFKFDITVPNNQSVFCNGALTRVDTLGNGDLVFHWETKHTLPSYLASFASDAFEKFTWSWVNHQGDTVPITINRCAYCDTGVVSYFENLTKVLDGFEADFGPQPFERIGYNIVPFSGGAMEHAANITFPGAYIPYGRTYEFLFGHELSHHWWGDHVTCAHAEEMWLNEGWASWCEARMMEHLYGTQAYNDYLNHEFGEVVHWIPYTDSAYLPLSPMPQTRTYGANTYKHGSMVVAALRSVMGDSAFFAACKSYQKDFSFQHATTEDLKKTFQKFTAEPLDSFMNQWVYQPGFPIWLPHMDYLGPTANGHRYRLRIEQKLTCGALHYFGPLNMPLHVHSSSGQHQLVDLRLPARDTASFEVEIPFEVDHYRFEKETFFPQAVTRETLNQNLSGVTAYGNVLVRFKGNGSSADSNQLVVRHSWTNPDGFIPGLCLNRYWEIESSLKQSVPGDLYFQYNGRNEKSTFGRVDIDFFKHRNEDSLELWYRKTPDFPWQVVSSIKNIGSINDAQGSFKISNPLNGQYAIATSFALGISASETSTRFAIYPNPAPQYVRIDRKQGSEAGFIYLCDPQGKVVGMKKWNAQQTYLEWPTWGLGGGVYFLIFQSEAGGYSQLGKVVIP